MQVSSGYIPVGNEKLHYLRSGSGSRLLIAFPGYGNNADTFLPFTQYLQRDYTILSFDMPHHGRSEWTNNVPLTRQALVTLVDTLKKEFGIDKVSLLGYSMGGRVCLTIIEMMPQSIDKVLLIAPD